MNKPNVTIDIGQNVVWEVERVCPLEKASYWWTKPQLKQIRDDYKNEVMMEGVRNLVKARVEQEEEDTRIIEQRVEEIMQRDPGSIANFLQSIPTKSEKLSTTFNSNLDSSVDSNSVSDSDTDSGSDSDTDSDSDSDTDSDSDSDSDSESSSSTSSSSLSEGKKEKKEDHLNGAESGIKITTKSSALSPNDCHDDKDKDTPSGSSSSSLCSVLSSPEVGFTKSESQNKVSKPPKSEAQKQNYLDLPPTTVIIKPVYNTIPSITLKPTSAGRITSEKNKSIGNKTNQSYEYDQTTDIEIESNLKSEDRKLAKSRFKQGVLAVVAMERLEKIVKRDAPPSTSSVHKMVSSSSRLLDMYLPSDDETEDEVDTRCSDEGGGSDISSYEDISECPVCLDLVDPEQQRKIILLRRMLCEECFFIYYINRGGKDRSNDYQRKLSKRTSVEIKQKNDKVDFNTERDVQILSSLKRCISSTNKSPMLPLLPMPKPKAPIIRDKMYINSEEKTERNTKTTTSRRKKSSAVQVDSEKPRRKK